MCIKSLKAGGSVACCGLVQSPTFEATVLPFILRGVNLLGVDSVEIPLAEKQAAWKQLARCAKLAAIDTAQYRDYPEAGSAGTGDLVRRRHDRPHLVKIGR